MNYTIKLELNNLNFLPKQNNLNDRIKKVQ